MIFVASGMIRLSDQELFFSHALVAVSACGPAALATKHTICAAFQPLSLKIPDREALCRRSHPNPLAWALLCLVRADFTCAKTRSSMTIADVSRELTPREHETAALATSGMSNKQIAHMLGLTEGSVKQHLHRVFTKLGVQNRIHLMLQAERLRHS